METKYLVTFKKYVHPFGKMEFQEIWNEKELENKTYYGDVEIIKIMKL